MDRNFLELSPWGGWGASLSARRAWIEIARIVFVPLANGVALRKESVDRNHVVLVVPAGCWLSLSARRAWIEIRMAPGA